MSDIFIFDSTKPEHYRTELNNFLQVNGGTVRLRWQTAHKGPDHQLVWTAICYIDEVEYGKASGKSVGHAKEMAAHIAHRALLFENFRKLAGMVA